MRKFSSLNALCFTLRLIVQLLWVNVRLYLTLKVDVIYVKSTLIELKKWLILKFEFPAPDCDWSIQICDLRYLRVYKNNQNFLMSILYCIDLIILSQTPFNKDMNLIKVNNIDKHLYHILCIFSIEIRCQARFDQDTFGRPFLVGPNLVQHIWSGPYLVQPIFGPNPYLVGAIFGPTKFGRCHIWSNQIWSVPYLVHPNLVSIYLVCT